LSEEFYISIIISNFKDVESLSTCLESIKKNVPLNDVEVIVVDYGTPNIKDFIRKYFPFVKLIQLKNDVGVPAQRNIGALISRGNYLFFLDNDTYVYAGCIENLVKVLERNSTIAVAQPKTLILSNPRYFNTTGGFLNMVGEASLRGYLERDEGQYQNLDEIFYAQNSGIIIRRDVFMKVGAYDPTYYFYYDETDLCFRVWLYGYQVVYVPSAVILHKVSSVRKINLMKSFYYERNKIITLLKNLEIEHMLFYVPLAVFYSLIVKILSTLRRRNLKIFAKKDILCNIR
jgi:GT2 family glycosyltransferase